MRSSIVRARKVEKDGRSSSGCSIPGIRVTGKWGLSWARDGKNRVARTEDGVEVGDAGTAAGAGAGAVTNLAHGGPAMHTSKPSDVAKAALMTDATGNGHGAMLPQPTGRARRRNGQAVPDGKSAEEVAGQVAVAPVAGDEDDHAVVQSLGNLEGGPAGAAGRRARE